MDFLASRVRLSTLVLVTIGMFDLVSTLMWMNQGHGEGNPLFAAIARDGGSIAFAGAKLIFLAVPIGLLEVVRKSRPVSVEQGTWLAAAFYFCFYAAHIVQLVS